MGPAAVRAHCSSAPEAEESRQSHGSVSVLACEERVTEVHVRAALLHQPRTLRGYNLSMMPGAEDAEPVGVVAIAASAGGVRALTILVSALPEGFPTAVMVVQHLDRGHKSMLADILDRRSALTVQEATMGGALERGVVYLAPPDKHLLVTMDGTIELTQTELVHFVRPSADLLFESVAASYAEAAVAVVLTGTGVDGTLGARAIKKMGGTVIVQDKETAEFSGMPSSVIQSGSADFILPLEQIAPLLVKLAVGAAP